MKNLIMLLLFFLLIYSQIIYAQEGNSRPTSYWQIGIGLGELPIGGSFKPSLTFGYHFNNHLYAGVIYQFKDQISRNGSSFNANSTDLDGLFKSSETVAQRFLLQLRCTPWKNGPYLSTGLVYNGKDQENMQFDSGSRNIAGETYNGAINIQQSRPGGWGFALGLGYQYNFKNGLSINTEWTPAWFQGYPEPAYEFSGTADLPAPAQIFLKEKMNKAFKSNVTNLYKVFHIGLAYRFK